MCALETVVQTFALPIGRRAQCISCLHSPLFGKADTGYLQIAEYDSRHCLIVVSQTVAVQGIPGSDLCAIGRHVDELVSAPHVAGGIDAAHRGSHLLIDRKSTRLNPSH